MILTVRLEYTLVKYRYEEYWWRIQNATNLESTVLGELTPLLARRWLAP